MVLKIILNIKEDRPPHHNYNSTEKHYSWNQFQSIFSSQLMNAIKIWQPIWMKVNA